MVVSRVIERYLNITEESVTSLICLGIELQRRSKVYFTTQRPENLSTVITRHGNGACAERIRRVVQIYGSQLVVESLKCSPVSIVAVRA